MHGVGGPSKGKTREASDQVVKGWRLRVSHLLVNSGGDFSWDHRDTKKPSRGPGDGIRLPGACDQGTPQPLPPSDASRTADRRPAPSMGNLSLRRIGDNS